MFETILAFGTIGFWVLLGIEVMLLFYLIETEAPGPATFSVLVVLGLLQFAGIPIYQSMLANPWLVMIFLLGYVAAGVVWATVRWYLFCKDQLYLYEACRNEWLRINAGGASVIPPEMKEKYKRDAGWFLCQINPKVRENKARIYIWLTYWPLSLCWTMINDPLKKLFEEVYRRISSTFQQISDRVWGIVADDFDIPKN